MDCIDSHLVLQLVGEHWCDQSYSTVWRWGVVGVLSVVLEAPLKCQLSVWEKDNLTDQSWSAHSLFTVSPSNRLEPRATTQCHQCRHWLSGLISVCLACQINAFLTACRPCRRPQMNISYPLWSNHNSKCITQLTLLLLLWIHLCLLLFFNSSFSFRYSV